MKTKLKTAMMAVSLITMSGITKFGWSQTVFIPTFTTHTKSNITRGSGDYKEFTVKANYNNFPTSNAIFDFLIEYKPRLCIRDSTYKNFIIYSNPLTKLMKNKHVPYLKVK